MERWGRAEMTNPISFCPCPWEAPDVMYALDVDKIRNRKSFGRRIMLNRLPVRVRRSRNISKPLIEDDKILGNKIVNWDEGRGGESHTLTRTGEIGGSDCCLLLLEKALHRFLLHKSAVR